MVREKVVECASFEFGYFQWKYSLMKTLSLTMVREEVPEFARLVSLITCFAALELFSLMLGKNSHSH